MNLLMTIHFLIATMMASVSVVVGAETKKYNLIAIVTDDQSRWSVSCYGGENLKTPHMDLLATEGAKFTNAFVNSPVCSPSRMSYLTGLHGTQVGVTDWLTGRQAGFSGMTPEVVSWPEVLRQNGYVTGLIGKWHVGSGAQSHPAKNGFSYFVGNLTGGWHPKNPKFIDNEGESKKYPGYSVDVCTDLAMDFVETNKSKPFALLLHYREPHAAYVPMPEQDMEAMKDLDPALPDYPGLPEKKVKGLMRDYLTSVRAVDRNLGRLLQRVKKLGLEKDTIVLFTSDHGYNVGHHGLRFKGNGYWLVEGKKGCRPNMFESSLAVPLMIKWPDGVKPGVEVDAMVSNVDVFPSVLSMLGVSPPKGHQTEGRDFTPWMKGVTVEDWRDAVFGQYQMINDAKDSMRMIRTDQWKLIRHYKVEGKDELYRLQKDPNEKQNLYGNPEYQKIQKELQQRLDQWMKRIGDNPESESPQKTKAKKNRKP